ncbi:unnamed protein product [Arabis nemorensis]|uniref:Uncharacterized protein n=1 Tax=Arabis nemorensis TaxID=586526 RepID=A0A565C9G2_9BRAS|nr:unnamed protein product [Arabis nemorensis]
MESCFCRIGGHNDRSFGSSGVGRQATAVCGLRGFIGVIISNRSSWNLFLGSWTINTKYYTTDASVCVSHICDDYSLPQSHPLVALVMLFDLSQNNIKFIEACASNPHFDKFNGDSQGVERIFGALSAHMWPGMILKSGDMITEPMLPHGEERESGYGLEYEVLSADPWENIEERWVSASETHSHGGSTSPKEVVDDELRPSPDNETERAVVTGEKPTKNDKCYEFEDVEPLMSEIGTTCD